MINNQVTKNALISVVNVVITGISLFFLYRYLLDTIGIDKVGVWSVVLATTSASRLAELGFSGSVVKFVAKYSAKNDIKKISSVISTGFVSISVLFLFGICIFYGPLLKILCYVLPSERQHDALVIFPYAISTVFLTATSGVFLSGIEGLNRTDIKSLILIFSNVIYLILCVLLVSEYDLLGMAYAQVLQAIIVFILGWFYIRSLLPQAPFFMNEWERPVFIEIARYGVNFQITSIMQMLFEPMTKSLLSKFGSIAMVGYFEMANRMVMQLRLILVSGHRVLVPVIAKFQEINPSDNDLIYINSYRLLVFLSLPFYALIIALSPYISDLWIGSYQVFFVFLMIICSVAWFINTLINPAYFSNLGTGNLRPNTISISFMGIFNGFFGLVLGVLFGGYGVIFSWFLSLCLGSAMIIYFYHVEKNLPFDILFKNSSQTLAFMSVIAILSSWGIFHMLKDNSSVLFMTCLSLLSFFMFIAFPIWNHPVRNKISNRKVF